MCGKCGNEYFVLNGKTGDLQRCKHCNPPLLQYGFWFMPEEEDTASEKVEDFVQMLSHSFHSVVRAVDKDQLKYMP